MVYDPSYSCNGKDNMDAKDMILWEFIFQNAICNDKRLKKYSIKDAMSI